MPLFKIEQYSADLCGNRWIEPSSQPYYVEASSRAVVDRQIETLPKFLGGFYVTQIFLSNLNEIHIQGG